MDWNRLEGDWKQLRGKAKEKWGKLTDDDLTAISGRRAQLEGKIQERYGYAKSQARKEIEDWYRSTESHLADEIDNLRTEIESLVSTVGRIANKQIGRAQVRAKLHMTWRPRSRGIHLLPSQSPWD